MVTKSSVVTKRGTKSIPTLVYKSTYGIAIIEEKIEEEIDQIIDDEPFIYYVIKSIEFRRYYCDNENCSVRERIAHAICNYTKDYSEQIDTEVRLILWLEHKDFIYRLASCFLMGKELLQQEFKNGTITNNSLDIIYNLYQADYKLYEIINCNWQEIQKEFEHDRKFSFNSSLELFLEIICNKTNYEYKKFLAPQLLLRERERLKGYKLYKEICEDISSYKELDKINPREEKRFSRKIEKLNRLTALNKLTHYWERKTLDFIKSKYEQERNVREYLSEKGIIGRDLNAIMNSRTFPKPPDYIMRNGIIYKGSNWQSTTGEINLARNPNKYTNNLR